MYRHPLIAVLFTILGYALGDAPIGAVFASAFFIGREITQAEYRWVETYGGGHRVNMPWWGGFDPRAWNRKALLDWSLPVLVSFTLAYLVGQVK